MLLNEFGVGYIGITSPSLSPLSRLDHFTLLNKSDAGVGGGGGGGISELLSLSVCLPVCLL